MVGWVASGSLVACPKTKIRGRWSARPDSLPAKTKRKNGGGRGPDGAQFQIWQRLSCRDVRWYCTSVCLYSAITSALHQLRTPFQGAVE